MNKHANETQHEKFVRVSREIEADESEANFDQTLKKIAKAPPPKEEKPAKADK